MEMRELVDKLNHAAEVYYNSGEEIMTNNEYDKLYDELSMIEEKTGIILADSPTQNVGAKLSGKLEKVAHEYPPLSLQKSKDVSDIMKWAGTHKTVLSWKLDGLTGLGTYKDGKLVMFATRGQEGVVGENITHNSKNMEGLPQKIKYKGKIIVRGEILMRERVFERVNENLRDGEDPYANCRNLAASTARLLDPRDAKGRELLFCAYNIMFMDDKIQTLHEQINFLEKQGFYTVKREQLNPNEIENAVNKWSQDVSMKDKFTVQDTADIPVDGLVFAFDDIAYGESLGRTGHHARSGFAFKWSDTKVETTITDVFWSASQSGRINPVAVFEPIQLEGTTVQRASVHNVTIAKKLRLGVGSKVSVYKANMIIPQIAETLISTGETIVPNMCPVCGSKVEVKTGSSDSEFLYCTNENCPAKHIGMMERFVSRFGMNIDGLAGKQIEQLVDEGFIKNALSLYQLTGSDYEKISKIPGWGDLSAKNMQKAVEKSRNANTSNFLYALGIPNFGHDAAKKVEMSIGIKKFTECVNPWLLDLRDIDGIGEVIEDSVKAWLADENNLLLYKGLMQEINITDKKTETTSISGLSFVITGSLEHFDNRDALKQKLEDAGAKVLGSVSAKVNYLVNNDIESTSGKNKKAKELGVQIISEEKLIEMIGN